MRNISNRNAIYRGKQKGAITMFSAVLILILLTEMIFYAVQVGIFEQRKSGNEMMQKQAFHVADSGIQLARKYLTKNSLLLTWPDEDRVGTADGWFSSTDTRWQSCDGATTGDSGEHPCFAEPDPVLRAKSFYYSVDGDPSLPLTPDTLSASGNETVTMYALLCMLDIDRNASPPVKGCTTEKASDPNNPAVGEMDWRYFIITVLARGEADCNDSGQECGAEALIADKIGTYSPGNDEGGGAAPLTARTNVPLSGTVEIVANPNGGGVGVPLSSWVNDRAPGDGECAPAVGTDPISPVSGSYATCEAQEWYEVDIRPDDFKCPTNVCQCEKGKDRMLTYASGNEREMGMDVVYDDKFPCDLWVQTFGMSPDAMKKAIDELQQNRVLEDCSTLDSTSIGPYWVSGPTCDLKSQIGAKGYPVLLISAAAETRVSAGAEFFGVLFTTDHEVPDAEFTGNGRATIYGAAIMDAEMKNFNGTFQIVYVEDAINGALTFPLFASLAGGWTDFHRSWK